MVFLFLVRGTLGSLYVKAPQLFGAAYEVRVCRFGSQVVNETDLIGNKHVFHLFCKHVQNLARLAAQGFAVHIIENAGIPIGMIHQSYRELRLLAH